ncbi:MAG: OadG family protein [Candidatus Aegiribacteria sp.]|nr:OadG family protein [Candidatus Aegiribacteria sp.]
MSLAGAVILSIIQFSTADIEGGFGIALVGMTTVFTGLVLLAFMLPVLERWIKDRFGLNRRAKNRSSLSQQDSKTMTPEEVAAVTSAIHAHFCLLDQVENMKLTWEAHDKPYTPWKLAGRAEHIQESGSLQNRVRSRPNA